MSQEPGQVIAQKYQLVRRLARGGMGAVWCARHLELDTEVALKFVRSDEGIDSSQGERFRREARAAAQIRSQHVVQIHDYGIDAGIPYIAMELLSGEDLESYLQRRGSVGLSEAVELLTQASKGLRAAHKSGVIHRDIKPSNLFIAELAGERVVKVLDFGIAKGKAQSGGDTTTQGQVFGSPAYMSPEQARGGVIDERSDVWSLGAVFYRMLTGKTPFGGANASDIVVNLCTADATPPSRLVAGLGDDVDAFFKRALARDVAERFQNVSELTAACVSLGAIRHATSAVTSEEKPQGRSEETARLERHADGSRAGRESERYPAATLRPSISPERPVYSAKRGVLAVASVLITLGTFGLWLARPAAKAIRGTSDFNVESDPASGFHSAPSHLQTSSVGQSKDVTAEVTSPVDTGVKQGEPSVPAGVKAAKKQDPVAPLTGRRSAPQPGESKSLAPVASPPSQSPVEKPATDPVFGLPVDHP